MNFRYPRGHCIGFYEIGVADLIRRGLQCQVSPGQLRPLMKCMDFIMTIRARDGEVVKAFIAESLISQMMDMPPSPVPTLTDIASLGVPVVGPKESGFLGGPGWRIDIVLVVDTRHVQPPCSSFRAFYDIRIKMERFTKDFTHVGTR